ncbi:hypothetical protein DL807_15525 [Shigella flexneri]|nr:hypothetical protein [Shigella flexneri]EGD7307219.1 hypothetical protein [Shigella flexneri]EGE2123656.1 hypothetical protein [Shigella flexneri]EGE2927353.1 hypothetical protein [Shigella flexneri]
MLTACWQYLGGCTSEFKRFFLTEHGSCQAIPVFSHDRASVRGRSPTRVYPQSGRISALAGREGREGRL